MTLPDPAKSCAARVISGNAVSKIARSRSTEAPLCESHVWINRLHAYLPGVSARYGPARLAVPGHSQARSYVHRLMTMPAKVACMHQRVVARTHFTEARMRPVSPLLILVLAGAVSAGRVVAQAKPMAAPKPMNAPKPTNAQKISNAMTAAPSSISAHAAIMDWPATEGGSMVSLRAGTNGWTCL